MKAMAKRANKRISFPKEMTVRMSTNRGAYEITRTTEQEVGHWLEATCFEDANTVSVNGNQ